MELSFFISLSFTKEKPHEDFERLFFIVHFFWIRIIC